MRSTFSISTWALAGCLALFLGCSQGEGDRCETKADCSDGLECRDNGTHNGVCSKGPGQGSTSVATSTETSATTSTSTGTGTSTDAGTDQADASVAPTDEDSGVGADATLSD
jgi:hypothetical protein